MVTPPPRPPRVLVVSDVQLLREALVWGLLKRDGIQVLPPEASAESARVTVRELVPDIVLLDCGMTHILTIATAIGATAAQGAGFAVEASGC